MTGDPLVSIRCLVYNHEPYLRQCLDGFVMQKTTFPFEAIVHDDASTDGSAAIIREYSEKYPDIIKPIFETENQYNKRDGSLRRIMDAALHPNSKYIAMCEGDDYWSDPNKLQLQVDFLESHPDFYMSCHGFMYFYEETKSFEKQDFLDYLPIDIFNGREYCVPSIDEFFQSKWFTQVLTIVRRREKYVDDKILKCYSKAYDYITCYYMLKAGKCALFKNVMGVYRKHRGGVYSGRNELKWKEEHLKENYILFELEKEERVLPILESDFKSIFIWRLKKKEIIEALKCGYRHFKYMPIIDFLSSINSVFLLLFKAAIRKKIFV